MLEDFQEALRDSELVHRRRWCGFGTWVRTLEPGDRTIAERLVADRDHNCRALARYFATKGATFNDQVVNRHRNGLCCGQTTTVTS